MNIQLRDSKPLQEAIRNKRRRDPSAPLPQIAKAQLHPELLNGIVECDREGFSIRSECLSGETRGEPNPQDVQNLKDFLPAPAKCKAVWKNVTLKQGDAMVAIPSELRFTFEDQSILAIHTQAVSDVTKLTSALPSDQSADFDATPSEGRISFTRVGAAIPQVDTSPMVINELKTQAAIYGVKWDNSASLETMAVLIGEARDAKDAKKKPAKELATV